MPDYSTMPVISFSEALTAVQQYASGLSPTEPELVSLLDGIRLALAEDLVADRDFPPFPRATRDGYAVRAEDVASVPAKLRCIGELKAGASEAHSSIMVTPGEAVEIMTGAPVPSGADAVVMVEYTETNRRQRDREEDASLPARTSSPQPPRRARAMSWCRVARA